MPDYGERLTPKIENAEKSLRKGNKASTLAGAFNRDVLVAMCSIRGLDVTVNKTVLANQLVDYVRVRQPYMALCSSCMLPITARPMDP